MSSSSRQKRSIASGLTSSAVLAILIGLASRSLIWGALTFALALAALAATYIMPVVRRIRASQKPVRDERIHSRHDVEIALLIVAATGLLVGIILRNAYFLILGGIAVLSRIAWKHRHG